MLCTQEVAIISQFGETSTTLCRQGIVLVNNLSNAAAKLERATRACDVANLYMFDKQSAAEMADRSYIAAKDEWAKHKVFCSGCREAS
jgi:hypothetical protein